MVTANPLTSRTGWPPDLAPGETVAVEGRFDWTTWAWDSAKWWIGLGVIMLGLPTLMGLGDGRNMAFPYIIGCIFAVIAIHFTAAKQEWLLTSQALHVKGRRPIPREMIHGFAGWGSNITVVTKRGANQRLIGIENARETRARLNEALNTNPMDEMAQA